MVDRMTAVVDGEACKGHGRCYMVAPDVFDSDDEGYPIVIAEATTETQVTGLERAIKNCPERAISAVVSTASR